jgi:hypothetical protein
MPLNNSQLAELVKRAKQKAQPVVSLPLLASQHPPPCRPPFPRPRRSRSLPPRPKISPSAGNSERSPGASIVGSTPCSTGRWRAGEYSYLLHQIRDGRTEHLGKDCRQVTLPGSSRTLPVRATPWRLITILPKDWQPPTSAE